MKIYVFDSVRDAADFERERVTPVAAVTAAGPEPSPWPTIVRPEEVEPVARKQRKRKVKKARKKARKERIIERTKSAKPERKIRKCGNCGKPGHQARTCPESSSRGEEPDAGRGEYKAKLSGEELRAAVQGLKEDGFDALEVSSKLKVPYTKVMENWEV